jgi:hypothetical protein
MADLVSILRFDCACLSSCAASSYFGIMSGVAKLIAQGKVGLTDYLFLVVSRIHGGLDYEYAHRGALFWYADRSLYGSAIQKPRYCTICVAGDAICSCDLRHTPFAAFARLLYLYYCLPELS